MESEKNSCGKPLIVWQNLNKRLSVNVPTKENARHKKLKPGCYSLKLFSTLSEQRTPEAFCFNNNTIPILPQEIFFVQSVFTPEIYSLGNPGVVYNYMPWKKVLVNNMNIKTNKHLLNKNQPYERQPLPPRKLSPPQYRQTPKKPRQQYQQGPKPAPKHKQKPSKCQLRSPYQYQLKQLTLSPHLSPQQQPPLSQSLLQRQLLLQRLLLLPPQRPLLPQQYQLWKQYRQKTRPWYTRLLSKYQPPGPYKYQPKKSIPTLQHISSLSSRPYVQRPQDISESPSLPPLPQLWLPKQEPKLWLPMQEPQLYLPKREIQQQPPQHRPKLWWPHQQQPLLSPTQK